MSRENLSISETLFAKSKINIHSGFPESLSEHTILVCENIFKLIQNSPSSVREDQTFLIEGILSALLHDIGKAHAGFQDLLLSSAGLKKVTRIDWSPELRHELISLYYGVNLFAFNDHKVLSKILTKFIAWVEMICKSENSQQKLNPYLLTKENLANSLIVVGLHHKGLINSISTNFTSLSKDYITYQKVSPMRQAKFAFISAWNGNFDKFTKYLDNLTSMTGIAFDCFKIKINQICLPNYLHPRSFENNSILETLDDLPFSKRVHNAILLGLLKAADHLASGHINIKVFPKLNSFSDYFKTKRFVFQNRLLTEDGLNNIILQAPTGSGKTYAALLWLKKNWKVNQRFIYILPYTASINAMYKRLKENFEPQNANVLAENIIVVHSKTQSFLYNLMQMASDSTDNAERIPDMTLDSVRDVIREIYFPIKICTAHQLLKLVLFGRNWEQLYVEMQSACIVFDEIHAYEPRILGLLFGLIEKLSLCGARFLIMTATLPNFIRDRLITDVFKGNIKLIGPCEKDSKDLALLQFPRHKLKVIDEDIIDFTCNSFEIIQERYVSQQTQLFICNTISTAQQIYNFFKQQFESEHLLLLHSRFCPIHRNLIENHLLADQLKIPKEIFILIATQVVEVSLDIDFEWGYTEIAPIDALIQRFGRVNRAGKDSITDETPANILIFNPAIYSSKIYPFRMDETIEALSEENKPISSEKLNEILNKVYKMGYSKEEEESFESGKHYAFLEHYEEKFKAGTIEDWVEKINDPERKSIDVLPFEFEKEYDSAIANNQYIQARNYLIPLTYYNEDDLIKRKDGIWISNPQALSYSEEEGLKRIKNIY